MISRANGAAEALHSVLSFFKANAAAWGDFSKALPAARNASLVNSAPCDRSAPSNELNQFA